MKNLKLFVFLGGTLLLLIVVISCRMTKCESIAYRLKGGCYFVFFYDGKIRTFFDNNPEYSDIDVFQKKYTVDSFFFMKMEPNLIRTDSIHFVYDDIEETTCMKFGLTIHNNSVISYVVYPNRKEGKYSYYITKVENYMIDNMIKTIINMPSGIYNLKEGTSCFQIRLFGEYGEREYIVGSPPQESYQDFSLFRDLIITINNRHVQYNAYISEYHENYIVNNFYSNKAIKVFFMSPEEP